MVGRTVKTGFAAYLEELLMAIWIKPQHSHSNLSLQSLLSVLSSLCSSQQPSAGYLVLACGAEVSLSYQTCGLCLFAVYEVHIRALRTDTLRPESVCVIVKYGGRQNTHTHTQGAVQPCVMPSY